MSEQERQARTGKKDTNGLVTKWPLVDISGALYNRPATTQDISKDEFVVLPPGFKNCDELAVFKDGGAYEVVAPVQESRLVPPPVETIEDVGGFDKRGGKK